MSARWLVERTRDSFDDVGAEFCQVVDGCLVFRNSIFEAPVLMIAAGHWITVCEAAE